MAEERNQFERIIDRIIEDYLKKVRMQFPTYITAPDGVRQKPTDLFRDYIRRFFQERRGVFSLDELEDTAQFFIQWLSEQEGVSERDEDEKQTMMGNDSAINEVVVKLYDAYKEIVTPEEMRNIVYEKLMEYERSLQRPLQRQDIFTIGDAIDNTLSHQFKQRTSQEDESLFFDYPRDTEEKRKGGISNSKRNKKIGI